MYHEAQKHKRVAKSLFRMNKKRFTGKLGFAIPGWCAAGIDLRQNEAALLAMRGDIKTHCDDLKDFCDTAALVSQMDRVVCVDTSVAHLAGALGINTHILLPFTPDWRWGLEPSERIWYQSVTLHRQAVYGDWDHPLSQVTAALGQSDKGH